MIYYYLVCLFILTIIIGVLINQKDKEHYVNHYVSTNSCGYNLGPMDRPPYQPSCFYYDIDKQNNQLYNVLDRTATNLDNELGRSINIDNKLSSIANNYNNKLNNLMAGPIVSGTKNNLATASQLLANAVAGGQFNENINKIYNFNEADMVNTVRSAIELYLSSVLNKALKNANINFDEYVSKSITIDIQNQIATPIFNMFLKNFNKNSYKDIVSILKKITESMNVSENIQIILNNAITNDTGLSKLINLANKSEVKLGDFVYFRYKLEKPITILCADNTNQLDIIVGGKVCSINNVNKTVRISYNYVMNPNLNQRCSGQSNIPTGTTVNYNNGPDGLPKWYPQSAGADCGLNAPVNLACKPSMWPTSNDSWVQTWIGGIDRVSDKMACGVSPTGYNLPVDVSLSILEKNLEKLITDCKQDLTL
jgi:hypothetical protein